jgi:hypothetical protein
MSGVSVINTCEARQPTFCRWQSLLDLGAAVEVGAWAAQPLPLDRDHDWNSHSTSKKARRISGISALTSTESP